jgi:hypothetical protein
LVEELVEPGRVGEPERPVEQPELRQDGPQVELLPPILPLQIPGVNSLLLNAVRVEQVGQRIIEEFLQAQPLPLRSWNSPRSISRGVV